jgi:hypothetical protein
LGVCAFIKDAGNKIKTMKITIEKIDCVIRILTFFAIAGGGGWAAYQYHLSGSNDWMNNIAIETNVLPYHDNLRLLVVHVKSKNPRNYEFILNSKQGDTFELRVRKIAMNAKENTVIAEDKEDLIQKVDLMKGTGGEYQFLPGAETDDMNSIVLPLNTTVSLTAKMNKNGEPDIDFMSTSTIVRIEP